MKSNLASFISTKVEKGLPSKIHGRGLFATDLITKGEVVAEKAGFILTHAELETIQPTGHIELQIGDNAFLAPKDIVDFEKNMIFINHSCNPNVGMRGDRKFVAMIDIKSGEELTIDYAMIDDNDYVMTCNCGSPKCRKQITGHDWKRLELQKRYSGYFSTYLQKKI